MEFTNVTSLIENVNLNITNASSSAIKVLQWQCEGEIDVSSYSGVQITSDDFLNKALEFLEIVKEKNPDLALTPEYSFPYEGLKRLVMDESLWPKTGSLFCFGTQGENISIFKNYLNEWERHEKINVIWDAVNNLKEEKNFVSPLIYFFISNAELYILPQIKTGNMLDKWRDLEASDLSLGNTVFVFDDKNSSNKFLSIICADVLHIKAEHILENVSGNITIFHPQLNENPRNKFFTTFRREILDNTGNTNRIITLNWASKTKVKGTQVYFNKPWSTFYKRHNKNLQGDNRRLRLRNLNLGYFFAYDGINEYWYCERKENIKYYSINKSDTGDAQGPAAHGYEPVMISTFDYSSKWLENSNSLFNDDVLIGELGKLEDRYLFPIQALTKNPDQSDFFFGSCFGHFEEGEIKTNDNELVSRMIVGSDEESDDERFGKLHLFLILVDNLKKGNIPDALSYLKENHTFTVDDDFPDNGSMVYNLKPFEDIEIRYPECLVVITNEKRENKIEKIVSKLSAKLSKRLRNQIIVYYEPLGKQGYIFYDKHLNESEIQNPNFTKNLADIRNTK